MTLRFRATLLAALTTAIASLASGAYAEIKMRLEWTPSMHHSWYWVAEDKGWYKEEGVKLTIEPGSGSVSTIQIVASGSHDVGQASHSALAVGRSKEGLKVRAIGALLRNNEMGILVPQGSGWKTPKDLVDNNVKILVSPGGFDTPFFEPWFKLAGTDAKKANFAYVDAKIKAAQYLSGGGDAMSTSPAFFRAILASKRPSEIMWMSDLGVNIPGTGIIANEEAIKTKGAEIRGFLKATYRAFDYVVSGKRYEEAYDILVKYRPEAKTDKQVAVNQLIDHEPMWVTAATKGKPWGYMAPSDWDSAIKQMGEVGAIPTGTAPTDYYTNELLPTVTN